MFSQGEVKALSKNKDNEWLVHVQKTRWVAAMAHSTLSPSPPSSRATVQRNHARNSLADWQAPSTSLQGGTAARELERYQKESRLTKRFGRCRWRQSQWWAVVLWRVPLISHVLHTDRDPQASRKRARRAAPERNDDEEPSAKRRRTGVDTPPSNPPLDTKKHATRRSRMEVDIPPLNPPSNIASNASLDKEKPPTKRRRTEVDTSPSNPPSNLASNPPLNPSSNSLLNPLPNSHSNPLSDPPLNPPSNPSSNPPLNPPPPAGAPLSILPTLPLDILYEVSDVINAILYHGVETASHLTDIRPPAATRRSDCFPSQQSLPSDTRIWYRGVDVEGFLWTSTWRRSRMPFRHATIGLGIAALRREQVPGEALSLSMTRHKAHALHLVAL